MRTREQNAEYLRKYRFRKKFDRYKESGDGICHYCGNPAETMHHINERHDDTSKENLLPLCHKCHLEILHICDKPNYYRQAFLKSPKNRVFNPKEPVTLQKTLIDILQSCNTSRIYNLTLLNSSTNKRIRIQEGSRRLVELVASWGYSKVCS